MSFDENGNWDYDEAAMRERLRPWRLLGIRTWIGDAAPVVVALVGFVVVVLGIVAVSLAGWYVAGRAVGAGVRDGAGPR